MPKLRKLLRRGPSPMDRILIRWVYGAPNELSFVRRFRLANRRWRRPLRVGFDADSEQYLVDSDGIRTFIARRSRLDFYLNGSDSRADRLRDEYLLARVPLSPGDVVVDIGANIGEVARLVASRYGAVPIAVEPDRREFKALLLNLQDSNAEVWNALLWSEDCEMAFFDANESGDSSLFAPRQNLDSEVRETTTLDRLLARSAHREKPIRLLKLEAEGAEPEILLGATETLRRTEFISADLGPERGMSAETTLAPVYEILADRGFRAIDAHPGRLVVLFQRR